MMIDKRLINTVADSKKWIGITVLWNWVALIGGIISAVVFSYILQAAYFNELGPISAVIFGSVSCKDEVAAIGQKAPDIAAYDLQGKEVKLDDWKGTRLLTFWSETCGRCVAELKEFEKLAEANPNKVQLIAINVDGDKVDTKAVVVKRQLTLPVIKDQLKITAERYQLIGTPTSFVITPEGNIQAKYEGAIPAADLDKLFKG